MTCRRPPVALGLRQAPSGHDPATEEQIESHDGDGGIFRPTAAPAGPACPSGADPASTGAVVRRAGIRRARSRHEQLPPADRPTARQWLCGDRCLFADRPAGRRAGDDRRLVRCRDRTDTGGVARLFGQAEAAQRHAGAIGGDRGLSPRDQWRGVHRPRARRNRHPSRHHQRRGGSAAGGAGLPFADRTGQ